MKTKVNTKKKVSTKPKSKALKQGAVSGSDYVRYRYSGKSSSTFWDIVNSLKGASISIFNDLLIFLIMCVGCACMFF